MIQKIAAELLGVEDGEGSDDFLKDMFEELDAKQDGKLTKEELLEFLKQLEQE